MIETGVSPQCAPYAGRSQHEMKVWLVAGFSHLAPRPSQFSPAIRTDKTMLSEVREFSAGRST